MSSPVAIVTGTSSGIGKATAETLLRQGWKVVGISRSSVTFDTPSYIHRCADLTNIEELTATSAEILAQYERIDALVNNAGIGYFAPHEELTLEQIKELVAINLLAPLLLTKLFLRALKKSRGAVVNISSFSAWESSSFGAAYAATKAGLKHFGDSLFEECRKTGLRVVTISPDITRTPFYEDLSFGPEDNPEAAVPPGRVAQTVLQALQQHEEAVMTHVVLRPQRLLLKKRALSGA